MFHFADDNRALDRETQHGYGTGGWKRFHHHIKWPPPDPPKKQLVLLQMAQIKNRGEKILENPFLSFRHRMNGGNSAKGAVSEKGCPLS